MWEVGELLVARAMTDDCAGYWRGKQLAKCLEH